MKRFSMQLLTGVLVVAALGVTAFGKGGGGGGGHGGGGRSGASSSGSRSRPSRAVSTRGHAHTPSKGAKGTTGVHRASNPFAKKAANPFAKKPAAKAVAKKGAAKRPAGRKPSARHARALKTMLSTNRALTTGQQAAAGKVLAGEPLSQVDREGLTSLLDNSKANLTPEQREAIIQGLKDDLVRRRSIQTRRVLKVFNDTEEPLTVWVKYHTLQGERWVWVPGEPDESAKALRFQVKPGVAAVLRGKDGKAIQADRVRIWARSASGDEWYEHKGEDLLLVPESSGSRHEYYAVKMEYHTHTFER